MTTATADKRKQARDTARKARAMAAQLERAAGVVSDAERMAAKRRPGRTVAVPELTAEQREFRELLESNDVEWLRWFFPDRPYGFWYAFTPQQVAMIDAIAEAIRSGGDQAIAASRGEGKTCIARRLAIKYVLSGRVSFVVLFAATAADAADSLQSIRAEIEENDRLAEYYPEVCSPVRGLEGVAQKAASMLVTGRRQDTGEGYVEEPCKFTWCGHEVTMPKVPGSPSAGAIIATRGLDAAVRGLNKKGRRPDVAIIDDPDTEKTARSEEQASKLEDRIDKAIGGLGGQQRSIARVMLTTIQNRTCVSYRYTDPAAKPSWKGKRFKFLLEPPTATALWQEYVERVTADLQKRDAAGEPSDPFARGAHGFYVTNRDAMEAGAVVANPNRYDPADLGDGTRLEESALQRYYNMVARIGAEAVATEYDNDPPAYTETTDDGLSVHRVVNQTSGYAQRVVPPGCDLLTMGIDVGKHLLHWAVIAYRHDATSYVIDYGVKQVWGTTLGSDEGLEQALISSIRILVSETRENPYQDENGNSKTISLTLIDEGWGLTTAAVRAACRDLAPDVYPAKGEGSGGKGEGGKPAGPFSAKQSRSWDIQPGDNWYRSEMRADKIRLYHHRSGYWKDWGIRRWLTAVDRPGTRFVWGTHDRTDRQRMADNLKFAHQVCACGYIEQQKGGRTIQVWGGRPGMNAAEDHLQDAQGLADVAANIRGLRLHSNVAPIAPMPTVQDSPIPKTAANPKGGWFAAQGARR